MLKRKLWSNKWFILSVCIAIFFGATSTRVVLAGTDVQLDKIIKGIIDTHIATIDAFIEILKLIW